MRYSYASFGMIAIGLIAFSIVMVFQRVTINNEADYYTLKEAMEASMLESVDIACYRLSTEDGGCGGKIKISKEKFVGNFTRRFAKNITGNSDAYTISFYDIMESPPKASILISNSTDSFSNQWDNFDLENALTAVIDANTSAESKSSGSSFCSGTVKSGEKEVTYYANPNLKTKTVSDYVLNTSIIGIDSNVYNNLISLYIDNISVVKDYLTSADIQTIGTWDKSLAYSKFKNGDSSRWNTFEGDNAKYRYFSPTTVGECDGTISSKIQILHDGSEYYYDKVYNGITDSKIINDSNIKAAISSNDYVIRITGKRVGGQKCDVGSYVLKYIIKWKYKYCE